MRKEYSFSIATTIIIAAAAMAVGLVLGSIVARAGGIRAALTDATQPAGVDFTPVWKAWHIIDDRFVPAAVASSTPFAATSTPESDERRVYGMISGLADSLDDPYTFFLPPTENEQFVEGMSGLFEGVGMEIDIKAGVLTVVSPIKGAPASRAGIKANDRILKIDGESTQGVSVTDAVKRIRGPKGTQVTLTISRDAWSTPREIKVTREIINIPTVTTEQKPGGIFVISVTTFAANSSDHFRNALREFVLSGDTKLILDLRGNPGGYLDSAVEMASWFLPSGAIVVTEDYAGNAHNIVHRSNGYDIFNDNLEMVTLVDKGSASASEILAGALHDHGITKLLGTNTFGKGSVQELIDITPGTALKLTVAHWLSPDGSHIPLTGIVPDVVVEVTDKDIEAGKDPQMEAAVKALSQ
jgi:carboxyl-terminal processing protease